LCPRGIKYTPLTVGRKALPMFFDFSIDFGSGFLPRIKKQGERDKYFFLNDTCVFEMNGKRVGKTKFPDLR